MSENREREERELAAGQPDSGTTDSAAPGGEDPADHKRNGDTRVGLTLRVVVAAYVLYLAYGLVQGFGETSGNERILIAVAIGVFVIAGGAILILSVKKLIGKEYIDAEENTEDEKREDR